MIQPLVAFDQFVNCCIYIPGDGWGWADETVSARLFRCYLQGHISSQWYLTVDTVAAVLGDLDHCYKSWRSEIERRQLPDYYRIGGYGGSEFGG